MANAIKNAPDDFYSNIQETKLCFNFNGLNIKKATTCMKSHATSND